MAHVFFQARAYAAYEGSVELAIKALKYQGDRRLVPILGDFLVEAFVRFYGDDMAVVPVPMHPIKLKRRGFNQSEELARHLSRRTGLRVVMALKRVSEGSSQTGYSRDERLASLSDAFDFNDELFSVGQRSHEGYHARRIGGRGTDRGRKRPRGEGILGEQVLLIDDVLTTGGTADACAQILFEHGAVSVNVLTVAR